MRDYHVAVIPGDGIGQEVTPEGVRVLDEVGRVTGAFKMRYVRASAWLRAGYFRQRHCKSDRADLVCKHDARSSGSGRPGRTSDQRSRRRARINSDPYAGFRRPEHDRRSGRRHHRTFTQTGSLAQHKDSKNPGLEETLCFEPLF